MSYGIDPDSDYLFDPQQFPPAGWCPECGMEIWTPGKDLCTRCERRNAPDDEE